MQPYQQRVVEEKAALDQTSRLGVLVCLQAVLVCCLVAADKPKLVTIPQAKKVVHKLQVVSFETMTMSCDCMHDRRRKGLHLVVDIEPPLATDELLEIPFEPDGGGHTPYQMSYLTPRGSQVFGGCKINRDGMRNIVIQQEVPIATIDVMFFSTKLDGKRAFKGPTLKSLKLDGKALPVPKE